MLSSTLLASCSQVWNLHDSLCPRSPYSAASTDPTDEPNTRLADFDLALPGSQPRFQYATLIPALRAAIALGCSIQPVSYFDRKHYFYHDQPSGYQITQYYHPFAKDGMVFLDTGHGLDEGKEIIIGIKHVQMEQDTARTQEQDAETSLVDFNRAGHPLIEIISLPQIYSPQIASAYVKKVQSLLFAVDAVTAGMESGGMRADVNVSVKRKNSSGTGQSYGEVTGLGTRTEIKNIGTIKGVEDAIRAERDRQIALLEAGGVVEGETRGWSMTNPTVTRRLRGKEGEVDYRYMPDPDIRPLYIGTDLIQHFTGTLPPSPEDLCDKLVGQYGLTPVDARDLLDLDNGLRMIYFQEVVASVQKLASHAGSKSNGVNVGRVVGNWVLHELGSLLSMHERAWTPEAVPAPSLGRIIHLLQQDQLTNTSAKQVLRMVFEGDQRPVEKLVEEDRLLFVPLPQAEYDCLAARIIEEHPDVVTDIQEKGKSGKINFLLGMMMRKGEKGRMQPAKAEETLRKHLEQSSPGL